MVRTQLQFSKTVKGHAKCQPDSNRQKYSYLEKTFLIVIANRKDVTAFIVTVNVKAD